MNDDLWIEDPPVMPKPPREKLPPWTALEALPWKEIMKLTETAK
jgi:hypothetical protein